MTPNSQCAPTIQLTGHDTVYGRVYVPANPYAKAIAGLVGSGEIPEDRLRFIRELGFAIEIK